MGDKRLSEVDRRVLELCNQRGIRVTQRGIAWKLEGRGVNITTTTLAMIRERDLEAPRSSLTAQKGSLQIRPLPP
jgi:hypothetical protein